ncbi:uncharacterized protein LOC134680010 [Cydia fagiglandana]|uniref:uncharacterized protein LOC134673067 n=1 Tax=Cydia fagiglandana TaxID=1458189 RepID=UPI002FEE5510
MAANWFDSILCVLIKMEKDVQIQNIQWNNQIELLFIQLYQAEPILWDVSLRDYKNKLRTYDAWSRISDILEIPVDKLQQKRNSLLSSYRAYKLKVKKSIKSGAGADEIYKPSWFAYEVLDSFLRDKDTPKKTITTEDKENVNKENEEENLEKSPPAQSQTIRRKQNPPELLHAGRMVEEALSTFNTTMKHCVKDTQDPDDCDLYGQLLAKKLRALSIEDRLRMMHTIDGMFLTCPQIRQVNPWSSSSQATATSTMPPSYSNPFTIISNNTLPSRPQKDVSIDKPFKPIIIKSSKIIRPHTNPF